MKEKKLVWVGSSKRDLKEFPDQAVDDIGFALGTVQQGGKPPEAKPLLGFGGASVLEIVVDSNRSTFRAVYTVRFAERIYVLHCFQKKSTQGRKTSKQDIDLIKQRLKEAEEIHRKWLKEQ